MSKHLYHTSKITESQTLICNHFRAHNCNDFEIDILDSINLDDNAERLKTEDIWIRLLMTAFPYGLNDNIKGLGNLTNSNIWNTVQKDPTKLPYFNFKFARVNKHRGNNRKRKNKGRTECKVENFEKLNEKEMFVKYFNSSQKDRKNIFGLLNQDIKSQITKLKIAS